MQGNFIVEPFHDVEGYYVLKTSDESGRLATINLDLERIVELIAALQAVLKIEPTELTGAAAQGQEALDRR